MNLLRIDFFRVKDVISAEQRQKIQHAVHELQASANEGKVESRVAEDSFDIPDFRGDFLAAVEAIRDLTRYRFEMKFDPGTLYPEHDGDRSAACAMGHHPGISGMAIRLEPIS